MYQPREERPGRYHAGQGPPASRPPRVVPPQVLFHVKHRRDAGFGNRITEHAWLVLDGRSDPILSYHICLTVARWCSAGIARHTHVALEPYGRHPMALIAINGWLVPEIRRLATTSWEAPRRYRPKAPRVSVSRETQPQSGAAALRRNRRHARSCRTAGCTPSGHLDEPGA